MTSLDQTVVVDAIAKHMDSLSEATRLIILLMAVFWWAGFSKQDPIEVLGFKLDRQHAFLGATLLYGVTYAALLLKLCRLCSLVFQVSDAYLEKALAVIFLHPWELNPFSFFGTSVGARAHACLGACGLVVLCPLFTASTLALKPINLDWPRLESGVGLLPLFIIAPVVMISMGIGFRIREVAPGLYADFHPTQLERALAIGAGYVVGFGGIYFSF